MNIKDQINNALSGMGVSIDKILPKNTRKIYPLYYFTTFKEREVVSEKEVKSIPHLHCTKCNSDLAENGNGMYYSGYVVIYKNDYFSLACSKKCLPENALSYHDQIHGNRNYVILPNMFKDNFEYYVVYNQVIYLYRYYFYSFRYTGVTWKDITEKVTTNSAGRCGDKIAYEWRNGTLSYGKGFDEAFSGKNLIKKKRIIEIVNDILKHQDGNQYELFSMMQQNNKKATIQK